MGWLEGGGTWGPFQIFNETRKNGKTKKNVEEVGTNYQKCLSKCYAFCKPYGSGFLCLISDWCYTSAPPPSQIPDYFLVACTSNIEEISLISSMSMISEETAMMIFLLKSLLLYGQISVVMHTVQALIFKVLPRI